MVKSVRVIATAGFLLLGWAAPAYRSEHFA